MENLRLSKEIAKKVNSIGGTAYFVGGYVRDKIRGVENYDIDIEVHGISQNDLENILKSFGNVNIIGKSFGIYNIEHKNFDIALPRKERKSGEGHKGFDVDVDPYLGVKNASKRRDFTINAIMQDILTGEIIDNFNGINDIKNGLIRFVNKESFIEDPLRVFRACQFASRFNYKITDETIELCKNINTSYLSKERVFEETSKALLKSKNPSIYFNYLDKMGQLQSWFNELKALQNIEQSPIYHKEGNVYTHTMMVLDEAATYRELVNYEMYFMFAALCHDLGK
ncbi:CCA tRNA nucleotidyltransferase, partial [Helcococcus kunzii]|uniref:CCA tRNA nucleotidyltransferase n=1 Tax=Helcococcus kunzii TaxID=40091 RepID=UPI003B0054B5